MLAVTLNYSISLTQREEILKKKQFDNDWLMFLGKMQFSPDESFIAKLRLLRLNDGPSQVMATKRTKFEQFWKNT